MHEWSNETAAVPICCLANAQPRERAWIGWRGEKTPLSSALARRSGAVPAAEVVGSIAQVRDPHAEGGPGYPSRSACGRGPRLVRCLAGAARLREHSVGAQWPAQRGGKPRVERKGKSRLERLPQRGRRARKRGLAILGRSGRRPRCRKSYRGDNWLVAAERPDRRRFLILRCWLFPPCCRMRRQG